MFASRFLTRSFKSASPSLILRCGAPIQSTRAFSATVAQLATITESVTHDHRELEEYYNNILSATDADTKVRWQNQFTWELARHSIAEELVVYRFGALHFQWKATGRQGS